MINDYYFWLNSVGYLEASANFGKNTKINSHNVTDEQLTKIKKSMIENNVSCGWKNLPELILAIMILHLYWKSSNIVNN